MLRSTLALFALLAACNRPSEFCLDEEANAEACDAPFDMDVCESAVSECSRRHDEALIAYRDCLQDLGIGICGECDGLSIVDQCDSNVFSTRPPEIQDAKDDCEEAFRRAVRNNACEQAIVGCDVEVTSVGAAFLPLGFLLGIALRRRRHRADLAPTVGSLGG